MKIPLPTRPPAALALLFLVAAPAMAGDDVRSRPAPWRPSPPLEPYFTCEHLPCSYACDHVVPRVIAPFFHRWYQAPPRTAVETLLPHSIEIPLPPELRPVPTRRLRATLDLRLRNARELWAAVTLRAMAPERAAPRLVRVRLLQFERPLYRLLGPTHWEGGPPREQTADRPTRPDLSSPGPEPVRSWSCTGPPGRHGEEPRRCRFELAPVLVLTSPPAPR